MKRSLTVIALLFGHFVTYAQITPYSWVALGPRGDLPSVEQGTGVNGRVRSIQILPSGETYRIYIGACGGGLWRAFGSLGPVWANIGNQLPNPSVGAFAVHPSDPDDILVGTGDDGAYFVQGGQGLFHTLDAGASPWAKVSLPVTPNYFFRVLYLPGNANVVLAATDSGLFRSSNGANGPWSLVLDGFISDLVIHPANPQLQFCTKATSYHGSDGSLYASVDAGDSWYPVATGVPGNSFGRARIAICRDAPNNIAFVHEWKEVLTNNTVSGVVLSTDGGTNWTDITPRGLELDTEGFRALAITFRPFNPEEIIVAANNIWRTFDGGQTWDSNSTTGPNNTDSIKPHQDISQLYFSPQTGDDILWQCSDGGVFDIVLPSVIPLIGSWNGPGDSPTSLQVSTVSDLAATHAIRAIGNQDDQAAATTDDGGTWTSSGCCDVYSVTITSDTQPTYWYIGSSGGLGKAWKVPIGSNRIDVADPNPLGVLFYNRFQDRVYSINQNSVLISQSSTATLPGAWRLEVNLPAGTGGLTGDNLNGQTLFAWGSSPGALTIIKENFGVWSVARTVTLDSGTNNIGRVIPSTERVGESWALMASTNPAVQIPEILHTLDEWQTAPSNVTGDLNTESKYASILDLAVMAFNPNVMFAATDVGVFVTQNGGVNWQPFQTGLPIVQCKRLQYAIDFNHTGNNELIAATFGHGVYEIQIPRPPLVYVDQRNADFRDGSFEHPLYTLADGLNTTPTGGMMALNGMTTYLVPAKLTKPMTITAYEAAALLTK